MNIRANFTITLFRGLLALVALTAIGCSTTQKILKTGNPELIYRHALELYEQGEWSKAGNLFNAVDGYTVGSSREDSLHFYRARCAFKDGDFQDATMQFDEFRRTFGRSVFLEDAEGMYTLSYYYMSPPSNRDQTFTQVTIMSIDEFISRYPESPQIENFQNMRKELVGRLHQKSFDNAYTYYKIGRYKSAIMAFKSARKEFPESEFRESVSYYIVASSYELARNSVESKKGDRYLSMIDSYYTFIAEFPDSSFRKEVDQMAAKGRDYLDRKKVNDGYVEKKEKVGLWERIFGSRSTEREALMSDDEKKRAQEISQQENAAHQIDRPEKRKKEPKEKKAKEKKKGTEQEK